VEKQLTPGQRRLSDELVRYWSNFAGTGDPNGDGLPAWMPFRSSKRVPYTQSLAPGKGNVKGVDYADEHKLGFWASLLRGA
jgi:para-nitrobenzyl esterase